ncbi:MAG: AbrB/MazE/SpoVT family DNA-binding domain-containing protein [Anaerolineales bacterium]
METYISVKGQIVIPSSLRKKYGITKGTKIRIIDKDGFLILQPLTEQHIQSLQGSLKGKGGLENLLKERQQDQERE